MGEHPDQAKVNAAREKLAEEAAKAGKSQEQPKKEEGKYKWQQPEPPAKDDVSE